MIKKLGLVWMSAGNSYFKEPIIKEIISFALNKFDKLIIMAPNEPAEHTYLALGYEKNKAKSKARLNANLLQNRAKRVKDKLDKKKQDKIQIIEWIDEIIPNKHYQNCYKQILKLFNSNNQFNSDSLKNAERVIDAKKESISEKMIREAAYYLLKELAFITASPEIYNAETVSYIYHQHWPIYEKYINGDYDNKKKKQLRFVLRETK